MEDIYTLQRSRVVRERQIRTNYSGSKLLPERSLTNPVMDNLIAEGGENFFNYLSWFGLVNEPDLLVLPSKNHYFYDCDDLKGVKTLINLKKLNLIKHLDSFVHVVNKIVSPKTKFVGCFYDHSTQNRVGLPARIYKKIINFIDLKVFREIDKNYVFRLMESNGFRVIDMTEINGITYFITQNQDSK
jgi:hypothetical protein